METTRISMIEYPTSGWDNHCALASLSQWLIEKINASDAKKFAKSHCFKQLSLAFGKIYGFKRPAKLKDIKDILDFYPHPFDKQAILSLPLRSLLHDSLNQSKAFKVNLYQQFIATANHIYYEEGTNSNQSLSPYSNVIYSNAGLLLKIKKISKIKNKSDKGFQELESQVLKPYWEKSGYNRYCRFVGGSIQLLPSSEKYKTTLGEFHHPMISADELSELCKSLKIRLNIYVTKTNTDGRTSTDYTKPVKTTKGYI